jgi:molybdopterin/thiamine biosynthesis adenylyltransferase/rhodanese-related sulfurtransferase/molybdopterin converting factor small subunit
MPVKVLIPTPLRPYTGQQAIVEIEGDNVGELLQNLTLQHADLRPHLFSPDGKLRSFVNIYLNDEDIRYLKREQTPVSASDTISIVPSVAGGSGPVLQAPPETELPELTNDDVKRYSRHLIMPEVGVEGQRRLKGARVLCVGAGGLGSPSSLYLAAAGVGTIGLVDYDVVDTSNLQRQVLFSTADVGRPKVEAARDRLKGLNPSLTINVHEMPLKSSNALQIFSGYDIIVDGADNFPTRYLVNDACVLSGKPNAYGSIFRFDGQASVFATKNGPCYRCLYPEPPPPGLVPSCAEGGVLGVLPGIIGVIQATEAIKLIIGAGEPLIGRLLLFDALRMSFRTLKLQRDPECPVCGDHPTVKTLIDYEQFCGITPTTTAAASGTLSSELETTVEALKSRVDRHDHVWILDVREKNEFDICRIPGSTLIPLGELPRRLNELPQGADAPDIVVHCKMGGRSAKAVNLLREKGFDRVQNLKGGILAWIDKIDPTLAKY